MCVSKCGIELVEILKRHTQSPVKLTVVVFSIFIDAKRYQISILPLTAIVRDGI